MADCWTAYFGCVSNTWSTVIRSYKSAQTNRTHGKIQCTPTFSSNRSKADIFDLVHFVLLMHICTVNLECF